MAKKIFILSEGFNEENYKDDEHSSPSKGEGYCPMTNLLDCYGEEIYGPNAFKHYGQDNPLAHSVISTIKQVRGKNNARVEIYRAVPNFNSDVEKKVKLFNKIIDYYREFNFFPMRSKRPEMANWVDHFRQKYEDLGYDDQQTAILKDLEAEIAKLSKQKVKLTINNRDWVTPVREYAKQHGESHLNGNYKIIKKTVLASQLYTDGNDLMEWGYNI